ncbi:tail tape measure protein [Rhizobium sp. Root483D2]|uniref:tail tape measure protein n=1 Tax=Rhizobium sp. Root483D2 TaxID=1736545 RepID=UPI000B0E913D|nr:tail tape measure protein [Rhizobium sp. Root483D2]
MSRPDIPVTISGDPKGFEAAMARIRARAGTTATSVAQSFIALKARIGGVAGIAAGIGLTATIGVIRDTAAAVASVGDEARKAGLDVKSFQELKFVAEQNRVGVDALIDGIKELNLRADEFVVTGGGSAADAFERLGLTAESLKEKLKDPSALFTEIIGKLGKFDKAAQIRIADEVFGGSGGEQFVQLIDKGEAKIRETIKAANDLGIVMNKDLIDKAAEIDRRFNLIASTVGTNLKSAIVSATASLAIFLDGFREFQNQMAVTLETKQAELGMRRLDIESKILEKKQEQRDEAEKLSSVARNLGFEDSKNDAVAGVTGQINSLQAELARVAEEEAQIVNVLNGRNKAETKPAGDSWTPPKVDQSSSSRGSGAKSAKEEEAAYIGVIKALKEEIELIGKSDVEREKMTSLREAEVSATSKEGQEIEKLIELKHRQEAAEDALQAKREQAQQAAEDFGATLDDQLGRIIDGTFEAKDALAALLQELLSAATGGKGLFAGLFGSIFGEGKTGILGSSAKPAVTPGNILGFGGARAGGGNVSPGRIYQINEHEKELFMPGVQGSIVAPSKLGSNPVSVTFAPQIDARGASVEAVARLEHALTRQQADFSANVVQTIRKANQSGVKLGKFH